MWKRHQNFTRQSKERCGRRGHGPVCVLTVLHLCSVLLCTTTAGADGHASQCQYRQGVRGQGSVLEVTLDAPLPPVYGYYVLVERLQDPNVFYEHSGQLKKSDGRVMYEVNGIPSHEKHRYKVKIRPHGRNPNNWLGGYRQVCLLDIPPPPAPPPPTPAPPAAPGPPRAVASPNIVMLSAGQAPEQEKPTRQKGQTSEEGGPPLVTIVVVMAGVVMLCLFVCLAVWRWGPKHKTRGKKPDHSILPSQSNIPGHKHTRGGIFDDNGARMEQNCPCTCPRCALMTRPSSATVSAGHTAYVHHSQPQHHHHHLDHHDHHYYHHHLQRSNSFSVSVSEISCSDCNDV